MGKTVLADESLLNILSTLSGKEGYTPGLIIGQPSQKKDLAIHFTATPSLKEDLTTSDDCIREFENIGENWLKIHMRNVTRSLPGGLYVLGIFIVGPKDIFNDKLGLQKVRSLISNLHSSSKSNIYLYGSNYANYKIVLHFCSKSKRFLSKSFDVQNMNLSMTPVTWKFVANPTSWYTIDCYYKMDSLLPYYNYNSKSTTLKQLLKGILASCKSNVDGCMCILNGHAKNNNNCDTLEDIRNFEINKMELKNENDKNKEVEESERFNMLAMMFSEPPDLDNKNDQDEVKGCISFDGVLSSRIFLHGSTSIEEAVNAVKEDLVRSMAVRLELHCDSLEETSNNDETIHHHLPRRVLAKHLPSGIMVSEYMFPDDTIEDIAISFKENFGIEVKPESIIYAEGESQEKVITVINKEKCGEISEKQTNRFNLLVAGLIGAIVVLIISIVAHFLI